MRRCIACGVRVYVGVYVGSMASLWADILSLLL